MNLTDGGGFVDSPPPAEMNLSIVKREETSSNGVDGVELNHNNQSSSAGSSGSSGGGKGNKEIVCSTCGKAYVNIRSLQMHRKVHTGETTCPICNKVMNRTSDIKRHIQMVHYGNNKGAGGEGSSGGSGGANSPVDSRMKY